MGIKITGYEHPPTPQQLSPDVIKKECPAGESKGCFLWDYDHTDDVVKFTPRILARNDLAKDDLSKVLEHERQHWRDFNRRASELKTAVDRAVKAGQDPRVDDRLDWMLYDYCQDAITFHRKIENLVFDSCKEPDSKRP
jgi:hypothetical protein